MVCLRPARFAVTAACLAVLLLSALPSAAGAQRESEQVAAIAHSEPMGDRFVGSVLAWGSGAIAWLQALFAAEHGHVVPATPPTP